jgi:hypothetical protein
MVIMPRSPECSTPKSSTVLPSFITKIELIESGDHPISLQLIGMPKPLGIQAEPLQPMGAGMHASGGLLIVAMRVPRSDVLVQLIVVHVGVRETQTCVYRMYRTS